MKRSLLSLMLLCFAMFGVVRAQETLTVHDGTATNGYVPVYGFYADAYLKCEMVYPAAELGDMEAGTITGMTFYASTPADDSWGSANFQVFLTEVANATISAYVGPGTVVYEGALDGTQSEVTITFTTPYVYNGGNLLVGVYNTVKGSYKSITWAGEEVTGASITGYSYNNLDEISAGQRNFLPKTTFGYTPGEVVGCGKPKQLAVNYTGGTTATVTWTGDATLYNIDVNGTVTNNVTSPYTLTDLEFGTTYAVKVQANCDGDLSDFTSAVNFTTDLCAPENQCEITYELADSYGDGWNGNTLSVVDVLTEDVIATLTIPSGGSTASGTVAVCDGRDIQFVWAGTSWPYENSFTIYDINGEIVCQHVKDDVGPSVGVLATYTMSCTESACRKPTNLTATEIGKRSITLSWTENGEATAWNLMVDRDLIENVTNPYTLTGLTPATTYILKVSPVCEVEKWSDEITITTEEACPAPTNLSATALTPYSATMTWKGSDDEYEMEYAVLGAGAVGDITYEFETDLEGWTGIIVNADQGEWLHSTEQPYGYDYSEIAHGGTGFAMCYSFVDYTGSYNTDAYLVSPSAYQINSGASLNFWYDMANDSYPEYFEVCVATAANPTAEDFTAIWTWSDAKASLDPNRKVPMGNSNMRHVNRNRYDNWREVTVDLSAYVGQTIWIAFHDVNYDAYEVWIDDVNVNAGAGGEITWIPVGTVTSPYTLENLDPGTGYLVHVRANCGEDGESAWISTSFTTPSLCDAPFDLEVTNLMPTTATLNWTGYQDGFEVRYRPAVSYEPIFEETFENGIPSTWTTIDNDTTTLNNWLALSGLMDAFSYYTSIPDWAHSGSDAAMSPSYANGVGAFATDQYLVTPQLTLDGTLRFYAASTYSDEFEVLLSTTTNEMSAFTITLRPMTAVSTTTGWDEISIDLSDYAGQQGYIAIHHVFTDGYFLIIDDFGLYNELDNEWNIVSTDAQFVDIEDLDPETEYEWQVRGENRDCGEEGYTVWSAMGNFTTPGLCDEIESISIDELTATSITLSWTGYQESYNVRYRTAADADEIFYDDFSEGMDAWTTSNLNEDENQPSTLYNLTFTDGTVMTVFGFAGNGTDQYLISPELEGVVEGSALEFMYYAYGGSTQTFQVGFSSTDNALTSFTWVDAYTTDEEDYYDYYEVEVPAGTKYFAIKSSGASNVLLLGDFYIYANYVPAGEWITYEGVTSPYTIDGLTPETVYQVYVQGVCGEGEYTEWMGGSIMTPELTTVTQSTDLIKGWNWFSTYIVGKPTDLLQMLENSLGENGIVIKSSEITTDYYEDYGWFGDLDAEGLMHDQMYMIQTSAACTVELEGMPANPAEVEITINPGWNWIGFPSSEPMNVVDALAGFQAVEGDILKSSEASTDYYGEEFGWYGELETMEPGQGFMYYSSSQDTKTLVFGSTSKARRFSFTTNIIKFKKHSIKRLEIQSIKPFKK